MQNNKDTGVTITVTVTVIKEFRGWHVCVISHFLCDFLLPSEYPSIWQLKEWSAYLQVHLKPLQQCRPLHEQWQQPMSVRLELVCCVGFKKTLVYVPLLSKILLWQINFETEVQKTNTKNDSHFKTEEHLQ